MKKMRWSLLIVFAVVSGCTCLDFKTPRAYRCSADGGENQCPQGWRCGLAGQCHEVGAPKPYACASDQDCESGWRCGPEQKCLDPQEEALRDNPMSAPPTIERLSPQLPMVRPELVATSEGFFHPPGPCEQYDYTVQPASFVSGGVLRRVLWGSNGRRVLVDGGVPTAAECDAGVNLTRLTLESHEVTLDGGQPLALAEVDDRVFVLVPNGGLCIYRWTPASPLAGSCTPAVFDFPAQRLRLLQANGEHHLVAFSSTHYALYNLQTNAVTPGAQARAPDNQVLKLNDVFASVNRERFFLQAATDRGIFVRSLDGELFVDAGTLPANIWEPASAEGLYCEASRSGAAPEPLAFRYGQPTYDPGEPFGPMMGVHTRTQIGDAGFVDGLSFFKVEEETGGPKDVCTSVPYPIWGSSTPFVYRRRMTSCQACPENRALRDFWFAEERDSEDLPPGTPEPDPVMRIEIRCESADGGAADWVQLSAQNNCGVDSDSNETPPLGTRFTTAVTTEGAHLDRMVQVSDLGHLWWSNYGSFIFRSVILDRVPTAVLDTPRGVRAFAAPDLFGPNFEQQFEVTRGGVFAEIPGFGYATTQDAFDESPIFVGVDGQKRWGLIGEQAEETNLLGIIEFTTQLFGARFIAHFTTADTFTKPYLGATTRNAQGRTVLIMTSFDALLAADVTEKVENPNTGGAGFGVADFLSSPVLEVKLIPLTRSPITSMVALPNPPVGTYADGYLLQAGRIFRFYAPNATVWRSEELLLDEGEPLKIITDERRGRVGMKDGSLWSLPGRVQLAPALPANEAPVTDYIQLCAHTFALANGGLYRLASAGSAIGQWEPIALSESMLPLRARKFAGGRMFVHRGQLMVFLPNGFVFRISGFECE